MMNPSPILVSAKDGIKNDLELDLEVDLSENYDQSRDKLLSYLVQKNYILTTLVYFQKITFRQNNETYASLRTKLSSLIEEPLDLMSDFKDNKLISSETRFIRVIIGETEP